ncbi:hypothetical protein J2S31_000478 [Nitrospina gracilis Nb-211]|nr:hypothetical protein [Nitrospina gracilis Nb-211]
MNLQRVRFPFILPYFNHNPLPRNRHPPPGLRLAGPRPEGALWFQNGAHGSSRSHPNAVGPVASDAVRARGSSQSLQRSSQPAPATRVRRVFNISSRKDSPEKLASSPFQFHLNNTKGYCAPGRTRTTLKVDYIIVP